MPINKECLHCKKNYTVKLSKKDRSKYCSKYCHSKKTIAKVLTDSKKCEECNKSFTESPSRLKKRRFCSCKCWRVNWAKSYNKTGEQHTRYKNGSGLYREKALSFYGKKCNQCESTFNIEVHHKDQNRKNNDIHNLEVLCFKCHKSAHSLYEKLPCLICKKTTNRIKSKYCSRACFDNRNIFKKTNCPICNKKVRLMKQKYCSRKCYRSLPVKKIKKKTIS